MKKVSNKEEKIKIKVSSSSSVKKVAGCIIKSYEENKEIEISTIGASSLNQAIKACTIARKFLAEQGRDLYLATGFKTLKVNEEEITAIVIIIKIS